MSLNYSGLKLLVILSIFSIVLAACTAAPMKLDETLTSNEGGIIVMSHSEFDQVSYEFKRKGTAGIGTYDTVPTNAGISFAIVKVPPGEYTVTQVSFGNYVLRDLDGEMAFRVMPGQLNYFGDIFLSRAFENGNVIPGHAQLLFVDKQDQLIAYMKKRFPSIVAQNKIDYTVISK